MTARAPLILRPYAPGDEARFTPRADVAQEMRAPNAHDWAKGPPPGHVWTLASWAGEVRGVVGAAPQAPRVWQLWAALADLSPREIAWALRLARSRIGWLRHAAMGLQYLALARADRPAAGRTLARLGFKAERCFVEHGLGQYVVMSRGN